MTTCTPTAPPTPSARPIGRTMEGGRLLRCARQKPPYWLSPAAVGESAGPRESSAPQRRQKRSSTPVWVESRGAWVDAAELRPGDVLREPGGERTPVESVRVIAPEPERVHNLTVAGLHTYYAGKAPVLVHNAGCAIRNPGPTRPGTRVPESFDLDVAGSSYWPGPRPR
jgi:hypothetical protein